MINVWAVYWVDPLEPPKYSPDYVYILRDSVARNLAAPHVFRVLTNVPHRLPDLWCLGMRHPEWAGWWSKINLFAPGMPQGPNLYLDLDVVIVGALDGLINERPQIAMPANWAQSGHGGCQSSVMAWGGECDQTRALWKQFEYEGARARHWGDQEYITHLLGGPGQGNILRIPDGQIVSYKYHCQTHLPPKAKVVVFHGLPNPHEVTDAWVTRSFTRTPASPTK